MAIDRRSFLKVTAAGAGAAAVGPLRDRLGAGQAPRPEAAPEEHWVPSVCLQCPAGCGILVRVVNGR